MVTKEPWSDAWDRGEELGRGGQGVTFLAHSKSDPAKICVLKLLKNTGSAQARRRMAREVVNLATVYQAGGRVPGVIDHNASPDTADAKTQMYLAMEYIEGDTLRQLVDRNGCLKIEDALAIATSICETVRIAHGEGVLHRDLKPENVIIQTQGGSVVAFILDYGLSFNDQANDGDDLTRTDEGFGNRFLVLPDFHGDDQRDRRSDLTAVAALFFYMITGLNPGPIRDGNGHAPHQRHSGCLDEIADGLSAHKLATFFAKAFSYEFELRFQTVDELAARLKELGQPVATTPTYDPVIIAQRAKELLHRHHRRTIVGRFQHETQQLVPDLHQLGQVLHAELAASEVNVTVRNGQPLKLPDGVDQVFSGPLLTFQFSNHPNMMATQIVIGSVGQECIVYQVSHESRDGQLRHLSTEEVLRYPGDEKPPFELIVSVARSDCGKLIEQMLVAVFNGELPAA